MLSTAARTSGPPRFHLGSPRPWGWCYLVLHLLNLRGREGHSVLQLQQVLVCSPAGLHKVLKVLGGGFLSVRLACSHAYLGEGSM